MYREIKLSLQRELKVNEGMQDKIKQNCARGMLGHDLNFYAEALTFH